MIGGSTYLANRRLAPDPGEKPFDHPAPWLNGEADLIGVLAYDLDCDQRGVCVVLAGVSAVSEDALDEFEFNSIAASVVIANDTNSFVCDGAVPYKFDNTITMKIALWGAGGHGGVVLDAVRQQGIYEPIAFFDDDTNMQTSRSRSGLPIFCSREHLTRLRSDGVEGMVIAIGDERHPRVSCGGCYEDRVRLVHHCASVGDRLP